MIAPPLLDAIVDRALEEDLALRRQREPPCRPVQQRRFHRGFEDGDALADDGVGEAQLACGGGEAAIAGDGAEQPEVVELRRIFHDS